MDVRRCSSAEVDSATKRALRILLEAAFEGDFSDADWAHTFGGHHALIVDTESDAILAHASVIPRRLWIDTEMFEAGYVEAVAVRPDLQNQGLGTHVMRALEPALDRFPLCALSTSSHAFYTRLAWQRWRGPSWVREASGARIRSADEDGGIMVRTTSGQTDLTADICCEARIGDDW